MIEVDEPKKAFELFFCLGAREVSDSGDALFERFDGC